MVEVKREDLVFTGSRAHATWRGENVVAFFIKSHPNLVYLNRTGKLVPKSELNNIYLSADSK